MTLLYTTVIENTLQTTSAEGADYTASLIIFYAAEISTHMVFLAAGKIFQAILIFNRNNDSTAFTQMRKQNLQKIFIRCIAANIALTILKYTNQTNIIIILGQIRLNVLKIAHMNRYILTFTMSISVDQTSLFRQIHTGHTAGFTSQCSGNGTTTAAHLQHFGILLHGNPFHNVFPQRRQVIQHRPTLLLLNGLAIFCGRQVLYNVKNFILYRPVTIEILSGIFAIVQCNFSDMLDILQTKSLSLSFTRLQCGIAPLPLPLPWIPYHSNPPYSYPKLL